MGSRVRFVLAVLGATTLLLLSAASALLSLAVWVGNGMEIDPGERDPWLWVPPAVASLVLLVLFVAVVMGFDLRSRRPHPAADGPPAG